MRKTWKRTALAVAGAVGLALSALAAATTIQPMVIDLTPTGRNASRTITVDNTSGAPLPVEIRVEEIAFDDSGATVAGRSDDLRVFPLQAVIPPGQSQAFRVQWAGNPAVDRGKSYYVTVAQVPVDLPSGQSGIQLLYNFQVLVSIAPPRVRPNLRIESASVGRDAEGGPAPVIVVRNDSATQAYLSRGELALTSRDANGQVLFQRTISPAELQETLGFGLVAPGQRRSMTLPISLPAGAGSLEARFIPASR